MSAIDWQPTLAQLDSSPNITTPAGQSVLKNLLSAGQAYEGAGRPDVMHESPQHQDWSRKKPSERIGVNEPLFYVDAFYTAVRGPVSVPLLTPDKLSGDDREAYGYWSKIVKLKGIPSATVKIGTGFLRDVLYIATARAREAAERDRPRGPTYGSIESALVSALSAAQAWLAMN